MKLFYDTKLWLLTLIVCWLVLGIRSKAMGASAFLVSDSNTNFLNLNLPLLLETQNGRVVDSVSKWENQRRPEIIKLFQDNVYGRTPVGCPQSLRFQITNQIPDALGGLAKLKRVEISFAGPGGSETIHLVLYVPAKVDKPAPCFLLICARGFENIDPERKTFNPYWPVKDLIARGYATAAFCNVDVVPDETNAFKEGAFRIFDGPGNRPQNAWGAIAAWAWGASRVMDYLQTDPDIDHQRIAVVGQSRGGKAALWAGACDERFAMAVSNESGSTGAALARGKTGERIQEINDRFPYWFCENYKQYNNREEALPVDQHMLAALIAPRLLYIASAAGDEWSDPENEFLTAVNAQPVYQLFGLEGLATRMMPKPDSPVFEGHIGYHLRSGNHNLTEYDWEQFMNFADKHLKKALVGEDKKRPS